MFCIVRTAYRAVLRLYGASSAVFVTLSLPTVYDLGMVSVVLVIIPIFGGSERANEKREIERGTIPLSVLSAVCIWHRQLSRTALWLYFIGMWCPCAIREYIRVYRWVGIMGIGHENTTDRHADKEMQGVNGGAVAGSNGQHAEPVKAVNELSDCLVVAAKVFSKLHIGCCNKSHLQGYPNALNVIKGFCT